MVRQIRNLKNAEELQSLIKDRAIRGQKTGLSFVNSRISMVNGGATTIYFNLDKGVWEEFSSGPNWSDQSSEEVNDVPRWIYARRKDINASLRLGYEYY